MQKLKSHFEVVSSQRGGILFLLLVCTGLLITYLFVDFNREPALDISSEEILALQAEIDSIRRLREEENKPKIYPFNPNFISDYKAYTLGLTTEEFDRLKSYRQEGKWINSVSDFKRITGVHDTVLDRISPYFKFPDWVTRTRRGNGFANRTSSQASSEIIDLNAATLEQLQEINGIGPALSQRIIAYRDKLGGFSHELQLYNVYGLSDEVITRALLRFKVHTPAPIQQLNINTASASDLATIPGVSFDLAKEIWEFRRLRERIDSLDELTKIQGITPRKLKLIQLYLSVE
ncbi:MAG: competence protein ComEA [Flavobacteriaceae bacterium]|nr:competence protein ComEA [Flavobacteriaceae bacterium]